MKSRLLIFVSLEILSGLGFGILGSYLFSFDDNSDIAASIFNTFVIGFISMLVGVVFIGYFHYRVTDRLNEFGNAIGWCFLGLVMFLIFYIIVNTLTFKLLPHYVSSIILPLIMPVIGAVIGMNYIIVRKKRDK